MPAIPDDIRSAAVAVVDRGYNVGLIDAVAEALMAERERCAKIVDEWPSNDNYVDEIAAAIRAPTASSSAG